jgi:tripartite-type tricarboxylate transporter receptor subunit TctC
MVAGLALLAAACGDVIDDELAGNGPEDGGNAYPTRPIELIVPWDAGGGTDRVARALAEGLSAEFGQQVNVVNRTGGGGATGHTAIANADPDGYTIGLSTVEIAMMRHMGLADVSISDMAPIAQVNFDPAGITVADGAPWGSVADLIADVEQNPQGITGSGTARGGIWDMGRVALLLEAGLDEDAITWVPSEGSAPALQELVAGGVDLSFASLPENAAMINEGRARPLAIMADQRSEDFPDVPTLAEEGYDVSIGAWRGLTAPEGTPDDVIAVLEEATRTVVESDHFIELMNNSGFGIVWRDSATFGSFMAQQDEEFAELMSAAGLTQ